MSSADRTKESLLARTEALCNAIYDDRSADPHGGDGYLSTILRAAKMSESSDYSDVPTLGEPKDYATSAQKELTIREQAAGLIKTTQDLSTLIRDLQELWLFGGLDTLRDGGGDGEERRRAVGVASVLEELARGSVGNAALKRDEGEKNG